LYSQQKSQTKHLTIITIISTYSILKLTSYFASKLKVSLPIVVAAWAVVTAVLAIETAVDVPVVTKLFSLKYVNI